MSTYMYNKLKLTPILFLLFSSQAYSKEQRFEQRKCQSIAQGIIDRTSTFLSRDAEISNGVFHMKSNEIVKINYSNNQYEVECSKTVAGKEVSLIKLTIDTGNDS